MGVQDISSSIQAASAVAIVLFSVLGYITARRALNESHRQADVAAAALAETRSQAQLSQAAVQAANNSVIEARRQTQFGRIPFVRLDRPHLAHGPSGEPQLDIRASNLGPELALETRLFVERQDQEGGDWFPDRQGTPMLPLLEYEHPKIFHYKATDLCDITASWDNAILAISVGNRPSKPPLVSQRLRVTLSYLTLLGTRVSQARIWETNGDVLHQTSNPWTWRLETLTLDPGPDNGAPIVVRRPG